MSSRTTGSITKSMASGQLNKDEIQKMLLHEQTFYTAKSKILMASNTETSWLNSVKSLFISALKIERYTELMSISHSPTVQQSINSLNDLEVDPVVPSEVHLSISLPIVWYETRRTLPKALQSSTNTFLFFTANYGNCKISASNCHVLDQQKMHVLAFKVVLSNPDREKYVTLTLWTRQFTYSDYKRNNGSHKKDQTAAALAVADYKGFKRNFFKYGSILLRVKDIVNDRVNGLNLSSDDTDRLSVSNHVLEQYMGTNSVFSLSASIVAKNITYNDRFYGISLPEYEKTLNIKTACIGLDQGKICVYENPYTGEHFMSIKIEKDSNKFIKVLPLQNGQNELDMSLPRIVKIKDSSSKLVVKFKNTQHVNEFIQQVQEYIEVTDYWHTDNISSTQKFDIRLILSDIESLSASYFEHIDRTTSIFNMKKNFANE